MDKGILAAAWIGMYILCCVLGFLPEQQGFSYYVMVAVSVCFFIPPFLLLRKARSDADMKTLRVVRQISIWSLCLTTALLVANFLSVLSASEALGTALHILLRIVSVPMGSSGGVISLFLWACLLYAGAPSKKKGK